MAARLLLTLLALLTGLAAQFAPAQARVCRSVGTEIGEVASIAPAQRRAAPAAARVLPDTGDFRGDSACVSADFGLRPVTVLQGIDRARE